jgi:predicted MFS family arabinose efflux permease
LRRLRARLSLLTLPIVSLFALQFLNGLITSPSITFLPIYVSGLGYSVVFLSLVVMLQRITGLVSSLAGGILGGSSRRRAAIVAGQVLYFAGAVVFLSRRPWAIAVFWAASGLGMGLYSLSSQSAFIDLAQPRALGILTALYYWAYTAGATAGNPAAGLILDRGGYAAMAVSLLALGVVTVGASAFLLPRMSPPAAQPRAPGVKGLFGYAGVIRRPPVILLLLVRMLPTYGYGMLLVFVPLLLSTAGASTTQIALFASVSSICAALAQLVTGRASDRASPRWPAITSFSALTASAACIGLFPASLAAIFVSGTVGVSAAWCLSTLSLPMVERAAGPADRSRVLGVLGLSWNVSMIVSALSGGFLYEAGRGLPFLVSAALGVPALVLTVVFFRMVSPGVALAGSRGVSYKGKERRRQ